MVALRKYTANPVLMMKAPKIGRALILLSQRRLICRLNEERHLVENMQDPRGFRGRMSDFGLYLGASAFCGSSEASELRVRLILDTACMVQGFGIV